MDSVNLNNFIDNYILNFLQNNEEIIIFFTNTNIKTTNDEIYGYQKYVNDLHFKTICTYLLNNNYIKSTNTILESRYEDKIKYHNSKINENSFYQQTILDYKNIDNVIIYKQNLKVIEPTMFPNIVHYSKYEQIVFSNNIINIIFMKYNINKLHDKWFYEISLNNKNNEIIDINEIKNIFFYLKNI